MWDASILKGVQDVYHMEIRHPTSVRMDLVFERQKAASFVGLACLHISSGRLRLSLVNIPGIDPGSVSANHFSLGTNSVLAAGLLDGIFDSIGNVLGTDEVKIKLRGSSVEHKTPGTCTVLHRRLVTRAAGGHDEPMIVLAFAALVHNCHGYPHEGEHATTQSQSGDVPSNLSTSC